MATKTAEYLVTYTVPATSRLYALMSAGEMLRKSVRVVGEAETRQVNPVWWEVTFLLAEDYEVADHPADATVESEYARP